MHKQILSTLVITAGALTAHAATVVDSWTTSGGAWDAATQSGYSHVGGILRPDNAGSTTQIRVVSVFSPPPGHSILSYDGEYAATGPSIQGFVLTVGDVLANVNTITLQISGILPNSPNFVMNSSDLETPLQVSGSSNVVVGGGIPINSTVTNLYTMSFDVSEFDLSAFTINFSFAMNSSFNSIELTQTAVPEPSTYALLLSGAGLAVVMLMRKRKREQAA